MLCEVEVFAGKNLLKYVAKNIADDDDENDDADDDDIFYSHVRKHQQQNTQ